MGEIVRIDRHTTVRGYIICHKCDGGFTHEEWQRSNHRVRCPECRSLETTVLEDVGGGLFKQIQSCATRDEQAR